MAQRLRSNSPTTTEMLSQDRARCPGDVPARAEANRPSGACRTRAHVDNGIEVSVIRPMSSRESLQRIRLDAEPLVSSLSSFVSSRLAWRLRSPAASDGSPPLHPMTAIASSSWSTDYTSQAGDRRLRHAESKVSCFGEGVVPDQRISANRSVRHSRGLARPTAHALPDHSPGCRLGEAGRSGRPGQSIKHRRRRLLEWTRHVMR